MTSPTMNMKSCYKSNTRYAVLLRAMRSANIGNEIHNWVQTHQGIGYQSLSNRAIAISVCHRWNRWVENVSFSPSCHSCNLHLYQTCNIRSCSMHQDLSETVRHFSQKSKTHQVICGHTFPIGIRVQHRWNRWVDKTYMLPSCHHCNLHLSFAHSTRSHCTHRDLQ
jgi:hypothetical protein